MISKVPLSQHWVGVFPAQYFTLLSDPNLAREIASRLSEDGGVRGASSAPDGAAAAMKDAQIHRTFAGSFVELMLGLVKFPGAGQHASVLIRVGVAEHDFVRASPGVKQRLVLGSLPNSAHDRRRSAQGIDRFEQWHGHEAGIVIAGRGRWRRL